MTIELAVPHRLELAAFVEALRHERRPVRPDVAWFQGDVSAFRDFYDVGMRGDEERVIQAFCAFLNERGWTTEREVGFIDVVAKKDGRRILAEAKGRTAAIGLDVDTMFGQLLRRMPDERPNQGTRFAVVVPIGVGCGRASS